MAEVTDAEPPAGTFAESSRGRSPVELPQTLHGQLFLLAYDRRRDRFDGDDRWRFGLALRTAMLTDPDLNGHLKDNQDRPDPVGVTRPGDPLLRAALDGIGANEHKDSTQAVAHDQRRVPGLVRTQLEAAGWLWVQRRRVLGIIPSARLPRTTRGCGYGWCRSCRRPTTTSRSRGRSTAPTSRGWPSGTPSGNGWLWLLFILGLAVGFPCAVVGPFILVGTLMKLWARRRPQATSPAGSPPPEPTSCVATSDGMRLEQLKTIARLRSSGALTERSSRRKDAGSFAASRYQDTCRRIIWSFINERTPLDALMRTTAIRERLSAGDNAGSFPLFRTFLIWLHDRGATQLKAVPMRISGHTPHWTPPATLNASSSHTCCSPSRASGLSPRTCLRPTSLPARHGKTPPMRRIASKW